LITGIYSYFTCSGQSGPSTHDSGVYHEPEVEVEENIDLAHVQEDNSEEDVHVQDDNSEEDAHVQEDNGEEDAHVQVQDGNGEEVNGQEVEGITEFNPDHIISNPGLYVLIDRFAPNIRDEVKRAFIAKGPTQPIGHIFPQSHDKRSFQKHWFRNYSWLEYSLEKNKAYCFYFYLFKHD
jgi:hypothetical protein